MKSSARLRFTLYLTACVVCAAPVARPARQPDTVLTVRFYNEALAPQETIYDAEQEVGALFSPAGVQTRWIDCSGDPTPQPCTGELAPGEIIVNLLPGPPVTGAEYKAGYAGGCCTAVIYYSSALALARQSRELAEAPLSVGQILGRFIGHEFGHLLLGVEHHHSARGLMHSPWTVEDLQILQSVRLVLSRDECKAIHAAMLLRTAPVVASVSH